MNYDPEFAGFCDVKKVAEDDPKLHVKFQTIESVAYLGRCQWAMASPFESQKVKKILLFLILGVESTSLIMKINRKCCKKAFI